MNITDEMVFALAKHLYTVRELHSRTATTSWGGLAPFQREYELEAARRALGKVALVADGCPACSRTMMRETSGLTCQTCGHDFGTAAIEESA